MDGLTITSTTETQEQLDHAASEDWRKPFEAAQPAAEDEEQETPVADEAGTGSESGSEKSGETKPKGGFSKRIDKLTARTYRLEEENRQLRDQLARQAQPSAEKQASDDEPKPEGYSTYEDFVSARARWAARQELHEQHNRQTQQDAAEQHAVVVQEYNDAVAKARAEIEDFEEIVGSSTSEIPEAVRAAIVEMGTDGPRLVYHLARHPEICEELAELSPLAAIRYLGRMESSLSGNASPTPKPKKAAPEPIRPVNGSSVRSSVRLDEMSPSEYIRLRNQQERERRR